MRRSRAASAAAAVSTAAAEAESAGGSPRTAAAAAARTRWAAGAADAAPVAWLAAAAARRRSAAVAASSLRLEAGNQSVSESPGRRATGTEPADALVPCQTDRLMKTIIGTGQQPDRQNFGHTNYGCIDGATVYGSRGPALSPLPPNPTHTRTPRTHPPPYHPYTATSAGVVASNKVASIASIASNGVATQRRPLHASPPRPVPSRPSSICMQPHNTTTLVTAVWSRANSKGAATQDFGALPDGVHAHGD